MTKTYIDPIFGYHIQDHPTLGWMDVGRILAYETAPPEVGYLVVKYLDGDKGNHTLHNLGVRKFKGTPPVDVHAIKLDKDMAYLRGIPGYSTAQHGAIIKAERTAGNAYVRNVRLSEMVCGPSSKGYMIRHLNGDYYDCRRDNLEVWCRTRKPKVISCRVGKRRYEIQIGADQNGAKVRAAFMAAVNDFASHLATPDSSGAYDFIGAVHE